MRVGVAAALRTVNAAGRFESAPAPRLARRSPGEGECRWLNGQSAVLKARRSWFESTPAHQSLTTVASPEISARRLVLKTPARHAGDRRLKSGRALQGAGSVNASTRRPRAPSQPTVGWGPDRTGAVRVEVPAGPPMARRLTEGCRHAEPAMQVRPLPSQPTALREGAKEAKAAKSLRFREDPSRSSPPSRLRVRQFQRHSSTAEQPVDNRPIVVRVRVPLPPGQRGQAPQPRGA